MERSEQYEDIVLALTDARPTPQDDFAAKLDELVAAGFPRRSRFGGSPLAGSVARFRVPSRRRLLFASGSTALAAIAIATLLVANNDSSSGPVALDARQEAKQPPHHQFSRAIPQASRGSLASGGAAGQESSSEIQPQLRPFARSSSATVQEASSGELLDSNASYSALNRATHREIERSAEIGLLADPADVGDDSAKVFSAVHNARGIVLHSTTTAGRNARAQFDLLIPSAKLGDALAAFSAIDEVHTRHEATADITAPAVALGERLQASRARIDGLLTQLSAAETESESEAIGIELRDERRHAAALRSRLAELHRRVDFSRVSLRIETGASSTEPGGSWGIGDAWGDAGRILGVAAGVTVVGLAILSPLALIFVFAWLAHRLWLRARRERALDA
ncbi:MAG TPA: DUF4349 domain-containing protein [Solirubrobacterales bacterium]|jgi:hypothetical protein|nr:DUF4349 domain-containing protein [Solirubrobacterales bacterium]